MALAVATLAGAAVAPSAHALGRPGDLDPTFNGGAPVSLQLARATPLSTFLGSVAGDGTGRILVAGGTSDANGKNAGVVARLDGNGALDPAFGTGGSTVVQTGEGSGVYRPYSMAQSVFAAPGGGVGFAAYRIRSDERGDQSAFELLGNGTPDLDFGSGGLATRDPATAPAYANSAAATAGPDGSVYVSGILEGTPASGNNRKLALTKFSPQGQLVTGFGNQGGTWVGSFSLYPTDTGTYGGPMIVQPGNKLLMAGTALWSDSRQAVLLARFSTITGQPDAAFGTKPGNTVVQARDPGGVGGDAQGTGLALGPLGAIYVAGAADDAQRHFAMTLLRFSPSGEPDYTFGSNGVKRFQLATGSDQYRRSSASAVAVQPDGKVLLAGTSSNGLDESEGVVLRVRPDGTLDTSFGTDGVVRLQLAAPGAAQRETYLSGATIIDGRLVLSGSTTDSATRGYVARLLLDPLPDPLAGALPAPGGAATPGPSPASGGGPGPAVAPKGVARFGASTLTVDAKGRLRLPLTCSKAGPCAGRVLVVAAGGRVVTAAAAKPRRAATYAAAAFSVPAGGRRTVVLRLRAAGRASLRGRRTLKARVVLAPAGAAARTSRVTLVVPRRP
ncbi:MAG: hypothetical protein QOK49_2378 [Baekduia sp.]|nr:hypothetical protein [Baekduia sp.]